EFFGAVQALPSTQNFVGDWTVNGRTVHVTATTHIDQGFRPLVVGSFVEVRGAVQTDGSINADRIQVRRSNDTSHFVNFFELYGNVQALPASGTLIGDWTVSNLIVHVSQSTEIKQNSSSSITVGSRVGITGTQKTDLSLDAARIRALKSIDSAQTFVSQ